MSREGPIKPAICADDQPELDFLGNQTEIKGAPARRLRQPWPAGDVHDTESRLAAIGFGVGTAEAEWVRGLCELIDPRGQRNAAIRAAAALVRQGSVSATAKALERELRSYLMNAWPRERDNAGPSADCSALRRHLFHIARLTDGDGLGWRWILELIER